MLPETHQQIGTKITWWSVLGTQNTTILILWRQSYLKLLWNVAIYLVYCNTENMKTWKHHIYYYDMKTKYIQYKIRSFLCKYVILITVAIFWYAPSLNRNYMSPWLWVVCNQVFCRLLSQTHIRYKWSNTIYRYIMNTH